MRLSRLCGLVLSLGLVFSTAPYAAPVQADIPPPYRHVEIKEDAKKAVLFISFNCEFCRSYFNSLARWGLSLPKEFKFEVVPVPVFQDKGSVIAARAWISAQKMGASQEQLMVFADNVFVSTGRGMSLENADVWLSAAQAAGLSIKKFQAAWMEAKAEEMIQLSSKTSLYDINATPSVAINGQYVITPDNTNGNMELFIRLASGLVSQHIERK